MSLRGPRRWIAILTCATVALVAVVDMDRPAPDALSRVHGQLEALADEGDCAACHGGWFGNMTDSCLACHEVIEAQIEERTGLHGVPVPPEGRRCARCHSEHHGPEFSIVNPISFARMGIPDRDAFDHELVGFAMAGRHLELDCAECHENAAVDVLLEGARRFIGLEGNCANCHDDPHEGRMVRACVRCHQQESFKARRFLGHDEHLPLVGGHARASCRDCHAPEDTHSLERLVASRPKLLPRACADCHEDPHRAPFLAGVAQALGTTRGSRCDACHADEHTSFREGGVELTANQHIFTGFLLAAPHDQAECAACHAAEAEDFTARHPGRLPDECHRCHDDPHGGQFAGQPIAADGCLSCHDRRHFAPSAFDANRHAETAFPLEGRHVEADCHACHEVSAAEAPRVFHGTPARCEACHTDAHRGFFAPFADELAAVEAGSCAGCHRPASFAGGGDEFDHARWTEFPVGGAHAENGCASCHRPAPERDAHGRTFGRVVDHFGEVAGCATCHADPHRGEFDTAELPREVEGRTGCARCHDDTSFRAFRDGFDHGQWTGFPLAGVHAATGCSSCHASRREPDRFGRTWERAVSAECALCHADPHAGQFRRKDRIDCARCHASGTSYSDLVFEHDRDARFPLDEGHAALACAACHRPVRHGDAQIVRYRPLGMKCVDCHGVQKGERLRRGGGRSR